MASLVLVIGIVGGVSLAAAAGARRTASVVDRLRSTSKVYDVNLNAVADIPIEKWAQVDKLPQVELAVDIEAQFGSPVTSDGSFDPRWENMIQVVVSDPRYFRDIDHPQIIAGQLPERPDEAVINQQAADLLDLQVGDHLSIRFFGLTDSEPVPTTGPPNEVTISAIFLAFDDALKDPEDPNLLPIIGYGPGALHPELTPPFGLRVYRLHDGDAGVPSFVAAARNILGVGTFATQESRSAASRANRSLRPYVFALATFALLVFAAGFLLVAQALGRDERRQADRAPTLRSLGVTDSQLLRLTVLRGSILAVGGGVVAMAIAVLGSPLMPLGDARLLETDRGVQFDRTTLGLGFIGIVVVVVGVAALSAWSERNRRASHPDVHGPLRWFSTRNSSPVSTVGISFALARPQGGTTVTPSRSLMGLLPAVVVMTASVVIGANLVRFSTTAVRYGWKWDSMVVLDQADPIAVNALLATNPDVGLVVEGWYGEVVAAGRTVPAVGLGHGEPDTSVKIIEGRAPMNDDEIVLGSTTMRAMRTSIGETIEVSTPDQPRTLQVVGTGVFPSFAPYQASDPTGLGVGAAVTLEGLTALGQQGGIGRRMLLVSAKPGHALDTATLGDELFGQTRQGQVYGRQRPVEVRGYDQMRGMP